MGVLTRVGTGQLVVTEPMTGPMAERIAELGIEGMALRLPSAGSDGGAADVLFASTGNHGPSRYLLLLRGAGRFGHQTSLLPVRARDRAVTFMLAPASGSRG